MALQARRPQTIDAVLADIEKRSGITVSSDAGKVVEPAPVRTAVEPEPTKDSPQPADKKSSKDRSREFRADVSQEMVKAILESRAPWQKQWDPSMGNDMPVNAVTQKPYRGGNSQWLGAINPSGDPRWATYKQAKEAGWQVRQGASGTQIEFWESVTRKKSDETMAKDREDLVKNVLTDRSGERVTDPTKNETVLIHKVYTVFHASQIDGMPPHVPEPVHPRHELAEKIAMSVGANVVVGSGQASYYHSKDTIDMPPRSAFHKDGGYESVLLHEAGHATGHKDRMNREAITSGKPFGSAEYAKEELRAEMASAILSRELGVPHDSSQHAAYAKSWAQAIKEDPNELFRAASDAQKIAGYMIEKAREKGVEVDLGPNSVLEATKKVVENQEQSADKKLPAEKTLGDDVRRWTGRVTGIAEDRSSVTMRATGIDTVIKMPAGHTVPDGLEKGSYGKLVAGKDNEPPKFQKIEMDKSKPRDKGVER